MVASEEREAHMDSLLQRERRGTTVAYIHEPFCQTHCLYCGFYNKGYRAENSKLFADTLIREFELWRGCTAVESSPVHALYLAGGTPTALEAVDLERI